jgi:hypothetical protein
MRLLNSLGGLLPAKQAVMAVRQRPGGQDSECLAARPAHSLPNEDEIVDLVGMFVDSSEELVWDGDPATLTDAQLETLIEKFEVMRATMMQTR